MAADRASILQSAQLHASKGNLDAALNEWKKLALESPNDGTVHNSIGDLQLRRNAKPDAITAYLQAAKSFRDEGAPLKAIAAYKKVLKIDPNRYDIYRFLGDLNAERGLLSSAVADYLTLAKAYLKDKKNKEALETYRVIVTHDPANLDAQERVAELCLQENLPQEAIRMYLQIGRERSAQGRTTEARDAYAAVLKLDPANREAEQFVNAEKQVTGSGPGKPGGVPKSEAPRGGSSQPTDMLGEARRRLEAGQYEGAEAMLSQLLSREPGNPEICRLLAQLHLKQGQLNVASNEYRFLAGSALRSQDYELAESLVNEFLAVEPQSVALLELLGDLYEEKGDGATAAVHIGKAVSILVEKPDPSMPSLPAELYERVKALDPHGQTRAQLAAIFEPSAAPRAAVQTSPTAPMPTPTPTIRSAGALAPAEPAAPAAPPASAKPATVVPVDRPLTLAKDAVAAAPAAEKPATVAVPPAAPAATPVVQEPDPATRYAMGVAFRNMGIPDEAIEEFKLCGKQPELLLDACIMIALCLKDLGKVAQGIAQMEEASRHPHCTGDKARNVLYELGLLYRLADKPEQALKVFEMIADYQDVRDHLNDLRSPQAAPVQ